MPWLKIKKSKKFCTVSGIHRNLFIIIESEHRPMPMLSTETRLIKSTYHSRIKFREL